jgi:hypothetical protein
LALRGMKGREAGEDCIMGGGGRNLYALPNISVIKSRMRGWTGHVALMRDEKCVQNFGHLSLKEESIRKT